MMNRAHFRSTIIAAGLVTLSVEAGFPNAGSSQRVQQTEAFVFRNVTVLPMDHDAAIAGQDVVVQDGTITAIGPTATLRVPRGALVVNGKDKFLMPGLTDMHVHLPDSSAPPARSENELFLYIANGITTVRSMAGFENHLSLRERVRHNQLVAPSLVLAGPGLDGDRVKTPDDGAREVRQQKAAGYDLIKILPGLSRASYDAIVRTARETGMPYVGHVPADVGIEHALESGQQTIEHLDGYLELLRGRNPLANEAFQPLIEKTRAARIWNVPTMAVMAINVGTVPDTRQLLERSELPYIARSYVDEWLNLLARSNIPKATADIIQANRMHLLKGLRDAGAGILFGTDSPQLFNVPGFSIYREAQMMEAAGLSRYEVLRSATALPSAYLRRSCGVISVGAWADLVLYAGNPLDDLNNLRSIDGVLTRGHWMTREDLQRRLGAIRQAPENYRLQVATHPFDGPWNADIASSRFNGSVLVQSASLEFVVSSDSVSITNHSIDKSGRDVGTGTSRFRTDGMPHVHDELMPAMSVVAKWSSDRVLDTVLTRPTGVTDHVTYELSSDGGTLVTRTAGPFGTQEIVFRRPSKSEAPGDARREIKALYDRASSAAVAARTLSDLDALHDWLDTPDCVYTDAGRPPRKWLEQRAYADVDLRTPLKSLSNLIQELEVQGDQAVAITVVKGVARIADGDGRFGSRDAEHDVETTATVRDVWVRVAGGWRRQSHTKTVANKITAVDGKPLSP